MDIKVFPDLEKTCSALAERIVELSRESIRQKKTFSLVLSGGRTPRLLYHLLGTQYAKKIQWNFVHLFWGDERWVPRNHKESNYAMAFETLISKVAIPQKNIHPMPVDARSPDKGADIYEKSLKDYFSDSESDTRGFAFDAVLLGLGEDGHTASLFPHSPALLETEKWVVPVQAPVSYPTRDRLTLTIPAINNSKNVFFLVSGEKKYKIVQSIFQREKTLRKKFPAERVQPKGQLIWFINQREGSRLDIRHLISNVECRDATPLSG